MKNFTANCVQGKEWYWSESCFTRTSMVWTTPFFGVKRIKTFSQISLFVTKFVDAVMQSSPSPSMCLLTSISQTKTAQHKTVNGGFSQNSFTIYILLKISHNQSNVMNSPKNDSEQNPKRRLLFKKLSTFTTLQKNFS